tara:strand:- start:572 stop:952 length:381 start_codon:yes stop_codon:yes gene_type:complete
MRHKGKVIAHVCKATLKDVSFVVQPAGRAKVLREGKKNVHAFARGELVDQIPIDGESIMTGHTDYDWNYNKIYKKPKIAKYNPYKAATFVDKYDVPLYNSDVAYLGLHGETNKPFILTFDEERANA